MRLAVGLFNSLTGSDVFKSHFTGNLVRYNVSDSIYEKTSKVYEENIVISVFNSLSDQFSDYSSDT